MPLSIAACRTVFPFSTVIWRPSIVSVTVSISPQNTSHPLRDLHIGERPVVLGELDALERAGQLDALLDRPVDDRDDDGRLPIAVVQRQGERHVEHLAD